MLYCDHVGSFRIHEDKTKYLLVPGNVRVCPRFMSLNSLEKMLFSTKFSMTKEYYWLVSNMSFIFHNKKGMPSFPLTNSIIFKDGFLTTNQTKYSMDLPLWPKDMGLGVFQEAFGECSWTWDGISDVRLATTTATTTTNTTTRFKQQKWSFDKHVPWCNSEFGIHATRAKKRSERQGRFQEIGTGKCPWSVLSYLNLVQFPTVMTLNSSKWASNDI